MRVRGEEREVGVRNVMRRRRSLEVVNDSDSF